MGNPYTSVSVSASYNANPPSDDGSAVADNQLEWDKHKTKLGDPLKTALESINTNNLTAHGLHFGQSFVTKSANYTVQAPGDRGKTILCTASPTITLPAVADAGDGFPLTIINIGTGTVTVDGNAAETVNGSATATLEAGGYTILTCDGSEWYGFVESEVKGTFTPTWNGFSADPSGDVAYTKRGNLVAMFVDGVGALVGTSNSTAMQWTAGLPDILKPTNAVNVPCLLVDSGSGVGGSVRFANSATVSFFSDQTGAGSWTNSGSKGLGNGWTCLYMLN